MAQKVTRVETQLVSKQPTFWTGRPIEISFLNLWGTPLDIILAKRVGGWSVQYDWGTPLDIILAKRVGGWSVQNELHARAVELKKSSNHAGKQNM